MRLTPSGGIIDVADPSEINASWQGETSMSAEENKAIARRFMEARVEGDWDALVEMLAPDFVSHSKLVPDQPPGREGEKWAMARPKTEGTASRARKDRARARRAGTQGSAAHPASLTSQGGAPNRGMAHQPLLRASQGGGRRLLRLPSPFGWSVGTGGRGRHR